MSNEIRYFSMFTGVGGFEMTYKLLPKSDKIYYKDIYFAVTEQKYNAWSRKIKALAPMMYAHAISTEAIKIVMKSLKELNNDTII